jgi:uncharacterized protein
MKHIWFSKQPQGPDRPDRGHCKTDPFKGVGIYFCTQNPTDIPDAILSQLGLKVQHALRAFTAKDRKEIKQTAENYPLSDFYKTDQVLTSLGIGEALVTAIE